MNCNIILHSQGSSGNDGPPGRPGAPGIKVVSTLIAKHICKQDLSDALFSDLHLPSPAMFREIVVSLDPLEPWDLLELLDLLDPLELLADLETVESL